MRRPPIAWLVTCSLVLAVASGAASADDGATTGVSTPEAARLERRVQRITEELRCLVCQNQTIADSHAELAVMLKSQVRTLLVKGGSDQDAVDFMVQRYGDFVLYRPPVKRSTWVLWFGPFVLMAGALALLLAKLRGGGLDAAGWNNDEREPGT